MTLNEAVLKVVETKSPVWVACKSFQNQETKRTHGYLVRRQIGEKAKRISFRKETLDNLPVLKIYLKEDPQCFVEQKGRKVKI